MSDLLRRQERLTAHLHAPRFGRCPARLGAFLNKRPFEFRQYLDHLPHGAACRDYSVNGLRDRPESHAPRFEIIEQPDKIMQRPA